jgi:LL-diaminopimelate aminotransferase
MAFANKNFSNIKENYLFSEIGRRVKEYTAAHPGKNIIKMGIGDVTRPLCPAVISAMHAAVDDMASTESFKGYPPAEGYDFLLERIIAYYARLGVDISASEIVVSDGCKSDLGNITDLFSDKNVVLIPDPVYPVYVDTNIMCGRKVTFIDGNEQNGFLPLPYPGLKADLIYLCSPNNPTGGVYDRAGLKAWVDFALENGSVILFDCAYEAFVREPGLPRSIYQIEGARECAIEFGTFSKTAGFTGVRCGYTVVPEALKVDGMSLNKMWLRRQSTKFNGVSYISQRAAAAAYSPEGVEQTKKTIDYYMANAALMAKTFESKGILFTGGKNSPYIWFKCWGGMSSWELFDYLLDTVGVVGTPGAGFGKNGEGWFRLTAFGNAENTAEAMRRISSIL